MKNLFLILLLSTIIVSYSAKADNVKTGDLPNADPALMTDQLLITRGKTTANVTENTLPGLILPGSTTQIPIPNGGTGYNFPHFYPQLLKTINSTADTTICAVGDSTTFGFGSTIPYSYPTQLANIITNKYGIKAEANSFMGAAKVGNQYFGSYDARISKGSSWSQSNSFISLGIDTYVASTNTNSFVFTPTNPVDTFKVYYIVNTANGALAATVSGGSTTVVNTAIGTNNTLGSLTITTTLGNNALSLTASSGTVAIVGEDAWDSSQKWVHIINIGGGGTTSTDWNVSTNGFSPANSLSYQAIGCNLVIDNLGINDYDTGIGVSTYTANMLALINAQKNASADVVAMTPVPANPSGGGASLAVQYSYMQAFRNLALANSLPLADVNLRYGSYANASGYNVYFDTFVHQLPAGYLDNANTVATAIMPPSLASNTFVGSPNAPVNIVYSSVNSSASAMGGVTIKNLQTNQFGFVDFFSSNATPYQWDIGVRNSDNSFNLFDNNTSSFPIIVNTSDNVGIGCSSNTKFGVCGTAQVTGYIYQSGSAAANLNGYLETYEAAAATTTALMPGLLVFGAQNPSDAFGVDNGYNSTSARFRTRVFASTIGDIAFSTHAHGTIPTSQSSFTDRMIIRGDSGFVGVGTPSPTSLLTLSNTTTSGVIETQTNSAGTCTHTPGSSSETVSCSSDRKFKENITNPSFFSAWLWDFPVREYTLKSTGERVIGVVAQELQKVHPEMVHENSDANGETFLTVDAPNIWRLVRAIQELQAFAAFVCLIALLAAIWHFVHYHHHHRKKRDVG